MRQAAVDRIQAALAIVGGMWLVFLLDHLLPQNLTQLGLRPRTLTGLFAIPLVPFLHGGLWHLIGNTLTLAILLVLAALTQPKWLESVAALVLLSGLLLWLFGRPGNHIGASLLVFSLITYLIVAGLRQRSLAPLGVSVLVVIFYSGTLRSGIAPTGDESISWEGHLCGAVAGVLVGLQSKPLARLLK